MKILAIETSCDETSVAVVEDGRKLHSLVVNSQIDLHSVYGGVVPEIAARSHVEVIIPVIKQALTEAEMNWSDIDAIAVTQGPGLLGALLIGVLTARTLAWALGKPLIPVHHILGHVYANWITEGPVYSTAYPEDQPKLPVLALIVSGGHTQIMYGKHHDDWRVIGRTSDDAVGEAFDKAAKVLGLPYPGGPSVARAAEAGDPHRYKLTTPRVDEKYGFSFSGLKTGLLRAVQKECCVGHDFPSFELAARLSDGQKADFAASFQYTAIAYLVDKMKRAYEEYKPSTVIIGGGVAASLPLRTALSEALPVEVFYAPQILCTDNAAMIGARAYFQAQYEEPVDPRSLDPIPTWPL
jgi:N6-L-threonylcarbamoyladenine synthase